MEHTTNTPLSFSGPFYFGDTAAQPMYSNQTPQQPRVLLQNSFTFGSASQHIGYAGYSQYQQQVPRYISAVQYPFAFGPQYAPYSRMPGNMPISQGYGQPHLPLEVGVAQHNWQQMHAGQTYSQQQQEQELACFCDLLGEPCQRSLRFGTNTFCPTSNEGQVQKQRRAARAAAAAAAAVVPQEPIDLTGDVAPQELDPIDLTTDGDDEVEITASQALQPQQHSEEEVVVDVDAFPAGHPPPKYAPCQATRGWGKGMRKRYDPKHISFALQSQSAELTAIALSGKETQAAEEAVKNDSGRYLEDNGAGKQPKGKKPALNAGECFAHHQLMTQVESDQPHAATSKRARTKDAAPVVSGDTVVDGPGSGSITSSGAQDTAMADVSASASRSEIAEQPRESKVRERGTPVGDKPDTLAGSKIVLSPGWERFLIDDDDETEEHSETGVLELIENPEMGVGLSKASDPVKSVAEVEPVRPKKRGRPPGVKNRSKEQKDAIEAKKQAEKDEQGASKSKKRNVCEEDSVAEGSGEPKAKKTKKETRAKPKNAESAPLTGGGKKVVDARARMKAKRKAYKADKLQSRADTATAEPTPMSSRQVTPVVEEEPNSARVPYVSEPEAASEPTAEEIAMYEAMFEDDAAAPEDTKSSTSAPIGASTASTAADDDESDNEGSAYLVHGIMPGVDGEESEEE